MNTTMAKAGTIVSALVFVLTSAGAHAVELGQDQVKCRAAIGKASTKFVGGLLKAHQKCRDLQLKTGNGCAATPAATIAALESKLRSDVAKKCNLSAARLATLGFANVCTDANPGDGFTLGDLQECIRTTHERMLGTCIGGLNAGETCGTLADCPDTVSGTACAGILATEYDPDVSGPLPPATLACQKALAHGGGKLVVAVLKTVQAWRNRVDKGCASDPDKMRTAIAKARAKAQATIVKQCDDASVSALGACEPDQTTVAGVCVGGTNAGEACTELADCPDYAPGTGCSGAAPCLTRAHEVAAGDAAASTPPDLIDVEYPCATPAMWPDAVEITTTGLGTDLDIGWTGISHDQSVPAEGRVTLAVSNCESTGFPCGDCSLSGPIDNVSGSTFQNHRCADRVWVSCASDADCMAAGAVGPCAYFFGGPLPLSAGGYPVCVLNQIDGNVIGTLNLDAGTAAATVPLLSRVYTDGTVPQPCPQCNGGVCGAGARAGRPCVVHGSGVFGDVSLDCPPDDGGHSGDLAIDLAIATGTQSVTLTAGSPSCRQNGYTSKKCFCDTCNNANAEACRSDADCPASGGNPGICGGKRCLGGANAGAPCSSTSACPGGLCDRPGEPTRPNACIDDTDVPGDGTACVDTEVAGDGRGACPEGPLDTVCSIQRYESCVTDADCANCVGCVPGQTCVAQPRACFVDNGAVGGAVSVDGTPDLPCDGEAHPTVGALFCVGPTGAPSVNSAAGLPGLARLQLPVVSVLDR